MRDPGGLEQGTVDRFRVLHVCTGNICRSPLAERLMRQGLSDRLGPAAEQVVVESAGTAGLVGSAMAPHSASVLRDYGLSGEDFLAREVAVAHVAPADLVLTATRRHRAAVVALQPRAATRTFTLREFDRLCTAVDPAALPAGPVVERARSLVRAAAAQRGRTPPAAPEDDDLADPVGLPREAFSACAELVHRSLQRPLDLLAGTPGPGVSGPVRQRL